MEFWRETLCSLANDFLSGNAAVDPNGGTEKNDSACRYCELTPLCRIMETGIVIGEEDEDS